MTLADRMIRLLWASGGEHVAERVLSSHWKVLPTGDAEGRALRDRLAGVLLRELPGGFDKIRRAVLDDELSLLDDAGRAAPSRSAVLAIVRALPVGSPS